ncbi:hypothetical protein [Pseudonocardia sp. GCM10023141]|uniref:hypothetical protein n=1 Tax=Pseudonocardia sp. GCM10023141 TaxID=3252653 RepID=UPI00361BD1A2
MMWTSTARTGCSTPSSTTFVTTLRDTPIDATDLPEYAGRLFDGYEARPHVQRLATWYRLERAGSQGVIDIVVSSMQAKVDAVAKAQADGLLTDRWSAADLLGQVLHICGLWSAMTPELAALVSDEDQAHRRTVVVDAVRALIAWSGRPGPRARIAAWWPSCDPTLGKPPCCRLGGCGLGGAG